ncbi:Ubiquitin carboxyl-terminal hydrolase [Heracleum sosnowskyi]|uniref:Ubiquitin carboxyl-terminal hydrolase n=1 Tax=Heracleum sosnowskyi TaxID=360622 RepID=A0AAD8JFW0_9APIA|nr:Ubiquitin carboxyl-terminal hydrolase [Heracleum sosnowskyi]
MKIKGQIDSRLMIKNLKHGLHNLHRLSLSASGIKVSLVSLLGAAGLILILKDGKARNFKILPWSSDENISEDKFLVVPGLQNLGNNCFLNVILQALASCSSFRSFVRKRVEEHEGSSVEELEEGMPLAVALDSLLEDLCTPRNETKVLSPRKVMMAINYYNHNFNLTNQQDAEEAFLHILSSLREELADLYVFNYGSLADAVCLADNRIVGLERRATQIELQRWKEYSLGPFDGILSSILTCHSCSNQISLDFHYFHSLHLPVMAGSSVEGCLKHFFAAEKLDDYFCSHCWHIAAVKYLSISNEYKADAVKVGNCIKEDSCDCRNLPMLRVLPWSKSYSRTSKQLNMAHSPEILCLHLQRVSPNMFGDLSKFQGHISFPLTLNMSWFMNSGGGLKSCTKDLPLWPSKPYCQPAFSFFKNLDMQLDTRRINHTVGQTEIISSVPEQIQAPSDVPKKTCVREEISISDSKGFLEIGSPKTNILMQTDDKIGGVCLGEEVTTDQLDDKSIQDSQGRPNLSSIGGHSGISADNALLQSKTKMTGNQLKTSTDMHIYCLASVVQHFGRAGGGHYIVYRRARALLKNGDQDQLPESTSAQWFGISDSKVYRVSEEDVLAADASLLFYEKISEAPTEF